METAVVGPNPIVDSYRVYERDGVEIHREFLYTDEYDIPPPEPASAPATTGTAPKPTEGGTPPARTDTAPAPAAPAAPPAPVVQEEAAPAIAPSRNNVPEGVPSGIPRRRSFLHQSDAA